MWLFCLSYFVNTFDFQAAWKNKQPEKGFLQKVLIVVSEPVFTVKCDVFLLHLVRLLRERYWQKSISRWLWIQVLILNDNIIWFAKAYCLCQFCCEYWLIWLPFQGDRIGCSFQMVSVCHQAWQSGYRIFSGCVCLNSLRP